MVATEPANLRTLVRRTTFDLIGLPPTEKQLATAREDYPRLIQELLASPRYGERWGRHWLDVVSYSDAKDGVLMYGDARIRPFAYTYRDYVIRALLDETLVLCGGEFGRTPAVEIPIGGGNPTGRNHNHHGFSVWLAGGGIKRGLAYGSTDDFGYRAVENRVHRHGDRWLGCG